jgi:hypothetical protein
LVCSLCEVVRKGSFLDRAKDTIAQELASSQRQKLILVLAIGCLWGAGCDACLGACPILVCHGQHIADSLMVTAVESIPASNSSSAQSGVLPNADKKDRMLLSVKAAVATK